MDRYKIIFKGEVMPTLDRRQVCAAMARLFNTTPDKLSPLFNGQATTLKTGLERAAAETYREALKGTGAIIYLQRIPADNNTPPPRVPTGSPAARHSPAALGLTPRQGNLLRDEERPSIVSREIDTSGMLLPPLDDTPLQAPAAPPPPAPATDHLSVADVGASIGPDTVQTPPPVAVKTSHLHLAQGKGVGDN